MAATGVNLSTFTWSGSSLSSTDLKYFSVIHSGISRCSFGFSISFDSGIVGKKFDWSALSSTSHWVEILSSSTTKLLTTDKPLFYQHIRVYTDKLMLRIFVLQFDTLLYDWHIDYFGCWIYSFQLVRRCDTTSFRILTVSQNCVKLNNNRLTWQICRW